MITERSFIEDEIADSAAAAKDAVNESGDITGDLHHDVTSVVTGAVESVADNAKDLAQSVSTELANFKSNASDFYTVGLWGYCKGNIEGGKSNLTECTDPAASFWFNFTEVLDLRASWAEKVFPNQVDRLGGVYKSSSKGVTATYIGAVVATVLLLGSGIISIVSGHLASIVGTLSVVRGQRYRFSSTLTHDSVLGNGNHQYRFVSYGDWSICVARWGSENSFSVIRNRGYTRSAHAGHQLAGDGIFYRSLCRVVIRLLLQLALEKTASRLQCGVYRSIITFISPCS